RTSDQNAAGLSSNGSSVSHATRTPAPPRAHRAVTVVLPHPGPAETSVSRRVRAAPTSRSTAGRGTVDGGTSGTVVRARVGSAAPVAPPPPSGSARGSTDAMGAGYARASRSAGRRCSGPALHGRPRDELHDDEDQTRDERGAHDEARGRRPGEEDDERGDRHDDDAHERSEEHTSELQSRENL